MPKIAKELLPYISPRKFGIHLSLNQSINYSFLVVAISKLQYPIYHLISRYENYYKVGQFLLKNGKANPNIKDNEGLTPLHHTGFLGHVEFTKLLLEQLSK